MPAFIVIMEHSYEETLSVLFALHVQPGMLFISIYVIQTLCLSHCFSCCSVSKWVPGSEQYVPTVSTHIFCFVLAVYIS